MTFHYKKVIPSEINILPPVKNGKDRESLLIYSEESKDLVIQTPKLKYNKDKGFFFSMIKHPEFLTFLEELSQRLIEIIYTKSETLFNGKNFTEEAISKSMEHFYRVDNDGLVYLEGLNYTGEDINSSISLILKIEKILFSKNKFSVKSITVKTKTHESKLRPDSCVLSDEDS